MKRAILVLGILSGCAAPTEPKAVAQEVWSCQNLRTGEVVTVPYSDPFTDVKPEHSICVHSSAGITVQ